MATKKKTGSMQHYLAKNAEAFVSHEAVVESTESSQTKISHSEVKESGFGAFDMDNFDKFYAEDYLPISTPTPTQPSRLDIPISTSGSDLQNVKQHKELLPAVQTPAKSILEEIEVEKTSESKYVTLYLKKDTITKLKKEAKRKNISASRLANIILDKVLDA